jgi:soluble lytic murein transglycosylase-like protein
MALEFYWLRTLNPQDNANEGANVLLDFLNSYGGDIHKALDAYNAGPGAADADTATTLWPDGVTRSYYDSVEKHLANLRAANANLACGGG